MEYLGAWGTLIHEKNLKSKISCQTPFKTSQVVLRTVRSLDSRRPYTYYRAKTASLFLYMQIYLTFQQVLSPQPGLRSPPSSVSFTSVYCISTQTIGCYWSEESFLSFIGYH
jgi:hypothetical protein